MPDIHARKPHAEPHAEPHTIRAAHRPEPVRSPRAARWRSARSQVGCAWGKGGLLSYALGGALSLFRAAGDAAPALVQYGHSKAVPQMAARPLTYFPRLLS